MSQHKSYWRQEARCAAYPQPSGDIETEAVVVGGGITGLTTAMHLKEAGMRVVVLEMNHIGQASTGNSSGHLDITTEEDMSQVIGKFGQEATRKVIDASKQTLDQIEAWDKAYDLNSRFKRVPGYLYAEVEKDVPSLEKETEAARSLGIDASFQPQTPLAFDTAASIMFPNLARFSPLQYVCGLAKVFVGNGCEIYENTRVEDMEGTTSCKVFTERGAVAARHVVLATHAPLFGFVSLQTRAYPRQSYCIAVRVKEEIPDALYWDTFEPYRYTRWASGDDPHLLIVGGADHATGDKEDTDSCFAELETYVRERYTVEAVEYRWSHEFYEPADDLPYIGRFPGKENMYIATAFSGDGLKFGAMAGKIISDLARGIDNPLAEILSPARVKPIASAKKMAVGLGNVARHYVADRIAGAETDDIENVPPGEGRIVAMDGKKLAVYRDNENQVHIMSPICTHAGCIVRWNAAESTWDCPCHGGRYDAYGKVIMAPPTCDLQREPGVGDSQPVTA